MSVAWETGLNDSSDINKTFEDCPYDSPLEKTEWIRGFISGSVESADDEEDLESELLIDDGW